MGEKVKLKLLRLLTEQVLNHIKCYKSIYENSNKIVKLLKKETFLRKSLKIRILVTLNWLRNLLIQFENKQEEKMEKRQFYKNATKTKMKESKKDESKPRIEIKRASQN